LKLVTWRYDLDLSLTGKFGYGPAGIPRWDIELPNLRESGCVETQKGNS